MGECISFLNVLPAFTLAPFLMQTSQARLPAPTSWCLWSSKGLTRKCSHPWVSTAGWFQDPLRIPKSAHCQVPCSRPSVLADSPSSCTTKSVLLILNLPWLDPCAFYPTAWILNAPRKMWLLSHTPVPSHTPCLLLFSGPSLQFKSHIPIKLFMLSPRKWAHSFLWVP